MEKNESKVWMYDVRTRRGKKLIWTVYADSVEEAESNAKTVCRLLGAVYLGNLTGDRVCCI